MSAPASNTGHLAPIAAGLPFIGRQRDTDLIETRFAEGWRLVTILGTAGMGKTRLAAHIAQRFAHTPRRVHFVEMARATSRDELLSLSVDHFGLKTPHKATEDDIEQLIGAHLARLGPALVILDNLEQIAATASDAIRGWLTQAPEALFLTTSRHRLGLQIEAIHELGPLSLSHDRGETSEAAHLFIHISDGIRAESISSKADLDAVDQIAALLDGIPLAIELAAGRSQVLSPTQILERLSKRFKLLRTHTQPTHHRWQTLQEALDWSWQLLDDDERHCLMQCACFVDGFSIDTAEEVIDLSQSPDAPEVMDLIEGLREKSLLRAWTPEAMPDALRLGFYESIRDFVLARAEEAGTTEANTHRWLSWCLDEIVQLNQITRLGKRSPRDHVLVESNNMMACARHFIAQGRRTDALRVLRTIGGILIPKLSSRFDMALFEEALDLKGEPDLEWEALARSHYAQLLIYHGDKNQALTECESALDFAEASADPYVIARVNSILGVRYTEHERFDAALTCFETSYQTFDRLGMARQTGQVIGMMARLYQTRGDMHLAEESYLKALHTLEGAQPRQHLTALHNYSTLLLALERLDEAAQASLTILGSPFITHNIRAQALALTNLSTVCILKGNLDEALDTIHKAIEHLRAFGDTRKLALNIAQLSIIHHLLGDLHTAKKHINDAIQHFEAGGDTQQATLLRVIKAMTVSSLGEPDTAEHLIQSAEANPLIKGDENLQAAVQIARAHLLLVSGDLKTPRQLLGSLRETPSKKQLLFRWDLKLAAVMLEHALKTSLPPELTIQPLATTFQIAGTKPHSLKRKDSSRRILLALAEHRLSHPGEGLSAYDLMEKGWPGEDLHPETGANRVYVVLNGLRKAGLGEFIARRSDGYLLNPEREVILMR